jgi:hypothetical protein
MEIFHIVARHLPAQDQFAAESGASRGSGRKTGVIRLPSADSDDRVGLFGYRVPDQELEFAQLVAATADRHVVIALDVEVDTAEVIPKNCLKSFEPLDGSWPVQERKVREASEYLTLLDRQSSKL